MNKLYDPVFDNQLKHQITASTQINANNMMKATAGSWDNKEGIPVLVDLDNRICIPVINKKG